MDVTEVFRDSIKNCDAYHEALYIARMNSRGKLWVVGSFVYKTIATVLYGGEKNHRDIDFLAEHLGERLIVPVGWKGLRNAFGNPKLVRGQREIDISSLDGTRIPPTIEIYLMNSTLTIQCIAYDVQERRIIGDMGKRALRERTVAVNNPNFDKDYFATKGYTLESYVLTKAEGLNFRVVLPDA